MKHFIAIITPQKSDLSCLIESLPNYTVQYILPENVVDYDLSLYSAIAILGGTEKMPLVLRSDARIKVEEQIAAGKRFFCEYMSSIEDMYVGNPVSTRFKRLIFNGEGSLEKGDILEDQCNDYIAPCFSKKLAPPILVYRDLIKAHSKTEILPEDVEKLSNWALWKERETLMLCGFRLCNFIKARFSPIAKWQLLIREILGWLTNENCSDLPIDRAYHLVSSVEKETFDSSLKECISSAVHWYHESKILIANGKEGVYEGFCTEIYADGSQKMALPIRNDCTGEASLAFFTDYLLSGNEASLQTSDQLEAYCFDRMQIKGGLHDGMLRWTDIAWNVCYQDDNARVLFPALLKMMYTKRYDHLDDCCSALDFLVKTTGTDGLRVSRTDNLTLDQKEMDRLHNTPSNFPCAHYNAFYSATLLLCGKLADREDFIAVGIKGLESLMAVYPKTIREQSETEELCRLILPLAWLFWVTKNPKHKEWLYTVTKDLQKMKHAKSGAYLEWDSDYSAACSQTEDAECSLLTQNGDPVVDMLYSLNWLPLGFAHAYDITGDPYFHELWEEIASFMIRAQIHSNNPDIDGVWTRGFDVDLMEVYGLPNDVGWGPWSIESGWSIGEIVAGLGMGFAEKNIFKE